MVKLNIRYGIYLNEVEPMPHQCVLCGKVYPNGSQEILTGCGECGGRKFYYISEPLAQEELRAAAEEAEEAGDKMEDIVREVLREEPREKYREDGTPSEEGEWIKVRPEDRERMERIERLKKSSERGVIDQIKVGTGEEREVKEEETKRRPKKRKLRVSTREKESASVVNIVEKGVYEINLKALLENSPIIIQKDGSYLIHLPSLFSKSPKEE